MCRSYKGFGSFSLGAGTAFAGLMLIFGFSATRTAVSAFFLLLGAVDLLFYTKYGEK